MTAKNYYYETPISAADVAGLAAWEAEWAKLGYTGRTVTAFTSEVVTRYIPITPQPPVLARYPLGKGLLIWRVERCAGGDPARAADQAKAAGVHWVALKVHDGTAHFNGDIRAWGQAFQAVAIEPWAWGYNYAADPRGEALVALARLDTYAWRGYLLDAESQYKNQPAAAQTWVQTFRAGSRAPLGLCSYRYPSLHPELPWAEFLAECDFHAPQLYWLQSTGETAPTTQLLRSLTELRAKRDLPVVPIGLASPNDAQTWWPTIGQLRNFHDGVLAQKLPGYGFWEWGWAEARAGFWAEIAAQFFAAG